MERSGRGKAGGRRRSPHGRPVIPRVPLQARGQRRVDAILDAAAGLIAESGLAALTVHGVAERAGTSIGSMYHFFPDLDAVIGGLIDRHLRGFGPLLAALAARDEREWSRMSAAAAVDAIVTPIFSYLRRHPDVLVLNASPEAGARFGKGKVELKHTGLDIIEGIFAARSPSLRPAVRRARAAVLVGAVEGVALLDRGTADPAKVLEELRRAVTAYLEAVEGTRQGRAPDLRSSPPRRPRPAPGASAPPRAPATRRR